MRKQIDELIQHLEEADEIYGDLISGASAQDRAQWLDDRASILNAIAYARSTFSSVG